MRRRIRTVAAIALLAGVAGFGLAGCTAQAGPPATPGAPTSGAPTVGTQTAGTATVAATVNGGFDLESADLGRPTYLYDAMLGVPKGTYREAFAGVTPAKDHAPTEAEEQANKRVLLGVLGRYGITDAQLNPVANYYRFDGQQGRTWPQRAAVVTATIVDGVVTGFTILDPGVGYAHEPTIAVPGHPETRAVVTLDYTRDYATNGGVASVALG